MPQLNTLCALLLAPHLLLLQGKLSQTVPISTLQAATAAAAAGNNAAGTMQHLLLQHHQQQQPGAVDMQQQLFAIQAVSLVPATQSECCGG